MSLRIRRHRDPPLRPLTPPPFLWAAPEAPEGFFTASDSRYWPTLHALARSLCEQACPLAVADHGLDAGQRAELVDLGVRLVDGTLDQGLKVLAASNHRRVSCAEAWLKPWTCSYSPFARTVWIDADAVVLRSGFHLLQLARTGSWLTRNHWSDRNHLGYRSLLVASQRSVSEERFQVICDVNTGVFAFTHGAPWVEAWWATVLDLLRRRLPSKTRDQAACILMFSTTEEPMPPLLVSPQYNRAANDLQAPQRHLRKCYGDVLDLEELRRDHPLDYVVHWLGSPKWNGK